MQEKILAENAKQKRSNVRLGHNWDNKVDLAEMGYGLDSCGAR
jgi:hypothetical protein